MKGLCNRFVLLMGIRILLLSLLGRNIFVKAMGMGDLASAAGGATGGGATGGTEKKEGEGEDKENKDKTTSNTIVQNNAYKGFNENSMSDVINRNLRDDLLSSIEAAVHGLSSKINTIETNFQDKITKVQDQVKNILPKEEFTIKLKLASLNKQKEELRRQVDGELERKRIRLV